MTARRIFNVFIIAALLPISAHAAPDELKGEGSTFAAAAYTSWAFSYAKEKRTHVAYKASSSGDGITQIVARSVDFGASDYALSSSELKKNDLLQFPTLVGGVVPVINIPGIKAGQLKLTGPVLAAIFSARLTKWNDAEIQALNPSLTLPNLAIKRIVRSDSSGTTATFTEYMSKVDPTWASRHPSGLIVTWPKGVDGAKGNDGVSAAVLATPGAIGYASANQVFRTGLAYALLQNRKMQFVAPTDEALAAAAKSTAASRDEKLSFIDLDVPGAWPITDATYILVERTPKHAERTRAVLSFFYWAFLRGDAMASETGYVPLPPAIQARVVGRFRDVQDAEGKSLDYMRALSKDPTVIAETLRPVSVNPS